MELILVGDADPRNREIVVSYLMRAGYQVTTATTGPEVIETARTERPDLILLDVLIPELDGFETTRRLKAQAQDEYLPVVLVTALDDVDSRVAGFRAGADEYLPKPVYRSELVTRVRNLLSLREERRSVAEKNKQLVELQQFKENLTQLLVHDLKNPLSALAANLDYARFEVRASGRSELGDALDDSLAACGRLQRMVANLLDINRFEEGRLELVVVPIEVRAQVKSLAREHARSAEERQATIFAEADDVVVHADRELLGRVLENLLESTLRITRRRGVVKISVGRASGPLSPDEAADRQDPGEPAQWIRFRIEREGPRIDADQRARLFEKYGTSEVGSAPRLSRGLGLYFAFLVAQAHGGKVYFDEEERPGFSAFVLDLPARPAVEEDTDPA